MVAVGVLVGCLGGLCDIGRVDGDIDRVNERVYPSYGGQSDFIRSMHELYALAPQHRS